MDVLLVGGLGVLVLAPALAVWARRAASCARRLVGDRRNDVTGRLLVALGCMALISCGVQLAVEMLGGGGQTFALFGVVKRILLPVLYASFAWVLLLPGHGFQMVRPPAWWSLMGWSVLASALVSLVDQRDSFSLSYFLQAFLLLGGMLLFAFVGFHTDFRLDRDQRVLATILAITGALEAVFNNWMGVFLSCAAPVFAAGLYAGIRLRKGWMALVSVAVMGLTAYNLFTDAHSSSAGMGQLAVVLALVTICFLPRVARLVLVVVGGLAAALLASRSPLIPLMAGRFNAYEDVTLAHRGFETHQVLALTGRSWSSWLFGMGPGGYVDLSASPDFVTLESSGRYLPAVDDVHLFTSWVMLKLGVVGLVAMTALLLAGVREVWSAVMLPSQPEPFDVLLAALFVGGVVLALPGATMLFATPLTLLAVGIMRARRITSPGVNPV